MWVELADYAANMRYLIIIIIIIIVIIKQESCATAKMTAQCVLYMGALKIFGTA